MMIVQLILVVLLTEKVVGLAIKQAEVDGTRQRYRETSAPPEKERKGPTAPVTVDPKPTRLGQRDQPTGANRKGSCEVCSDLLKRSSFCSHITRKPAVSISEREEQTPTFVVDVDLVGDQPCQTPHEHENCENHLLHIEFPKNFTAKYARCSCPGLAGRTYLDSSNFIVNVIFRHSSTDDHLVANYAERNRYTSRLIKKTAALLCPQLDSDIVLTKAGKRARRP